MNPNPSRLRAGLLAAGLALACAARVFAITAPVLTTPTGGSTGYMPHPGFTWQPVTGATSYTIELSSNSGFTPPLLATRADLAIPRYVPVAPLAAGTLYWRVTAFDAAGASSTSTPASYTVGTPAHVVNIIGTDDLAAIRAKLASAVATPGSILNFPAGANYTFDVASDAAAFLFTLNNAANLIVNGNGASILIKNKPHMGFMKITRSSRVTVRDLVVDYDPVPHSLVRVVGNSSTADNLDLEVELMPVAGQQSACYPELTHNTIFTDHWSWAALLDKNNRGRLKPGTPSAFGIGAADVSRLNGTTSPARYRIYHPGSTSGSCFAADDILAILCRLNMGSFASTSNVADMTFEGITSYASPMGNYYSFDGSELKVLNCRSLLRDNTRYLSANADGVHCRANSVGPWVEGCTFTGNGDDGVALYNKGMAVTDKPSTTRLVVKNDFMNLAVGDVFRIFHPNDGRFLGASYTVATVNTADETTVTFTPALTTTDYNDLVLYADTAIGDDQRVQLFNASRRNDRFMITGNTFTVRARGTIVRAATGMIENNDYLGCSSPGIALYNEAAQWFNGSYSREVTIVGNHLEHCGFDTLGKDVGAITVRFNQIDSVNGKIVDAFAPGSLHETIVIRDNTITDFPQHGIFFANATNSLVSENTFNSTTAGFTHPGGHYGIVARTTYNTRVTYNDFTGELRALTGTFSASGNTGLVHAPAPLDNTDPSGIAVTGSWSPGTGGSGFYGVNYLFTTAGGAKSVQFTPAIEQSRSYVVQIRWSSHANRATNVPVDILHAGGTTTVTVNQQQPGGDWFTLGTFTLAPASGHGVKIRTDGTNGYVVADSIRLVPAP